MKYACRKCGVIHHGIRSRCGACGFTDEDAPGHENWCERINKPEPGMVFK